MPQTQLIFHVYQVSVDTTNPIRVVRGFKNRSEYGPEEGSVRAINETEHSDLIDTFI